MNEYVLTRLAKDDIFNIWAYIAKNSESAADRVEQALYHACAFVAESPLRGHTRPDLTQRFLRFWTLHRYPNYTVVYRPDATPIQIIAVLHGKRNLRSILRQRL
jgi:plasmid stabilization system protein ParE